MKKDDKVRILEKGVHTNNQQLYKKEIYNYRIIGEYAFYNCRHLSKVLFDDNLKFISSYAFARTNLSCVYLPDSVKSIENDAFNGCSNLTYLRLPPSFICLSKNALRGCCNLKKVVLPNCLNQFDILYRSGTDLNQLVVYVRYRSLTHTALMNMNDKIKYICY